MTTTAFPRVAAAALIVLAAITLTGCSNISQLINGEGDVFSLKIGDCYNDQSAGEETEEITSVPLVDCDEPHDNEVYAITDMTGDEFPGLDATIAEAEAFCTDEFEGFVGFDYQSSVLYPSIIYPTAETWAQGDRELLCALSELDENGDVVQVTGTLKNAAR